MAQDSRVEVRPRILFLDAYDSFSNNIIALIETATDANVVSIKIDDPKYLREDYDARFRSFLAQFDAVVAGPGPGNPVDDDDVGLIGKLWGLPDQDALPVLGICLGFQSLALSLGAAVRRLEEPRHGMIATISHKGESLFTPNVEVTATQYNSLHAIAGYTAEHLARKSSQLWLPSWQCPSLQPLAWNFGDDENGPILMAFRHTKKPFWGVQYHPESVCTNGGGAKVIENWWAEAQKYIGFHRMRPCKSLAPLSTAKMPRSNTDPNHRPLVDEHESSTWHRNVASVKHMEIPLHGQPIVDIVEKLKSQGTQVHLLESGTGSDSKPLNTETGRYSILGCDDLENSERLEYSTSTKVLKHFYHGKIEEQQLLPISLWDYLKDFMAARRATGGPETTPFWGGLIGFISYEGCLESINVKPIRRNAALPDLCFNFVSRSIVIDHELSKVYVQSIRPHESDWLKDTVRLLSPCYSTETDQSKTNGCTSKTPTATTTKDAHLAQNGIKRKLKSSLRAPKQAKYCQKIRLCQEALRAGDSYELCLTDRTLISPHQPESHWHTYKRLRRLNPAPLGAFLDLQCSTADITILSSSPERFVCWNRKGECQFRPIKGTVRKSPSMTRAKAQKILKSPKERAENLMILDLIRHDLHGVVGARNVHVKKLMSIEEYQTVYQLVSVIDGQIPTSEGRSGLDVLAASLPPGSMTGAPKKRSCELLQHIEGGEPRGIYSGVLGYLDVGGGADFSVVIRTAYKVDARDGSAESKQWRVGAGGAVTVQSTEIGEWEEMESKRDAVLSALLSVG